MTSDQDEEIRTLVDLAEAVKTEMEASSLSEERQAILVESGYSSEVAQEAVRRLEEMSSTTETLPKIDSPAGEDYQETTEVESIDILVEEECQAIQPAESQALQEERFQKQEIIPLEKETLTSIVAKARREDTIARIEKKAKSIDGLFNSASMGVIIYSATEIIIDYIAWDLGGVGLAALGLTAGLIWNSFNSRYAREYFQSIALTKAGVDPKEQDPHLHDILEMGDNGVGIGDIAKYCQDDGAWMIGRLEKRVRGKYVFYDGKRKIKMSIGKTEVRKLEYGKTLSRSEVEALPKGTPLLVEYLSPASDKGRKYKMLSTGFSRYPELLPPAEEREHTEINTNGENHPVFFRNGNGQENLFTILIDPQAEDVPALPEAETPKLEAEPETQKLEARVMPERGDVVRFRHKKGKSPAKEYVGQYKQTLNGQHFFSSGQSHMIVPESETEILAYLERTGNPLDTATLKGVKKGTPLLVERCATQDYVERDLIKNMFGKASEVQLLEQENDGKNYVSYTVCTKKSYSRGRLKNLHAPSGAFMPSFIQGSFIIDCLGEDKEVILKDDDTEPLEKIYLMTEYDKSQRRSEGKLRQKVKKEIEKLRDLESTLKKGDIVEFEHEHEGHHQWHVAFYHGKDTTHTELARRTDENGALCNIEHYLTEEITILARYAQPENPAGWAEIEQAPRGTSMILRKTKGSYEQNTTWIGKKIGISLGKNVADGSAVYYLEMKQIRTEINHPLVIPESRFEDGDFEAYILEKK